MFASKDLFFSKPSGYQISRSVRLRSSASAYFNRTLTTPTNNKIWTWSGWVKRGTLGSSVSLFDGATGTGTYGGIFFDASNCLNFQDRNAPTDNALLVTTQVFRDPSAWYHIVVAVDTTQATSSNRIKFYVNGSQITSFSTATYFSLNFNGYINSAIQHDLGRLFSALYFDGYLTEVNFIDGQAMTPSSFGQTNTITGVWQPIKYTGTYGTNGFYLNFSDNSNNTATTIGKDYSGNGNNWTPNNISVTAGVTYDSMLDVPTLFADGGNGRGNYAVLNPLLNSGYSTTYSEGNLQLSGSFGVGQSSIFVNSGKWYVEMSYSAIGGTPTLVGPLGSVAGVSYQNDGNKNINSTITSYGATYTTGDLIGCAFDVDSGTTEFFKNGASQGVITQPLGTSVMFRTSSNAASGTNTLRVNFGQRPFTYTPPTGFVALNTQNLPTPTISNGANYMAATLYTGTGASQSVSNAVNGISFQPDFIWLKRRSGVADHALMNTVVGATLGLSSNNTGAEFNQSANFASFNTDGFTVQGTSTSYNASASTFVGWQWKAGGTAVSNTAGTITSSVSANPTAGISIATYTGTGTTTGDSFGHGLGTQPKMVIIKDRTTATGWNVLFPDFMTSGQYMALNLTNGITNSASSGWGGSLPDSTKVYVGGSSWTNTNGDNYVAYCFSEVAGYSKFGRYTGNGSTDGPFVFCGFRPRWVLIKCSSTGGAGYEWELVDTSRNTSNVTNFVLYPNLSDAEATAGSAILDITSNGFKLRGGANIINASSATYIFATFAENPFKNSLAR